MSEMNRRESSGWLGRNWLFIKGAVALALLSVPLFCYANAQYRWTPLQRFYIGQCAWARSLEVVFSMKTSNWNVIELANRKGDVRTAFDGGVVPGETRSGKKVIPFEPSDASKGAGFTQLRLTRAVLNNAAMRAYLRHWIFGDRGLRELALPGVIGGGLVFVAGLVFGIPRDLKRNRERVNGRRLRGPEEVTAGQFNRRNGSDGVGFMIVRGWLDRLLRRTDLLRIPRRLESSHLLLAGDTGVGKSTLLRMLLYQIKARGDIAIVCDFAREFTAQFFEPNKDVLLNPLDTRMPYWNPSGEITHPAEALTLSKALFPDRERDNPFFVDSSRSIFAHLLTCGMSSEELIDCLCRPEEIDRRIAGTSLATLISPTAPAQRAGVLASLNMVTPSLQLLPRKGETTSTWSASSWSKNPSGWIFLPSLPTYRDSLRPLTSVWLDMLILHLMNEGVASNGRRVWFVLDELASLHKLPQLHTALTENRKTGNPVVIGFQGKGQLEKLYGDSAEVMLSQPATKVFMRSSDPRSAQWVADAIGKEEFERMRESRTDGRFPADNRKSRSDTHEEKERYLIMPAEITGMPNLHGILKCGNLVVRMQFPHIPVRVKQPAFIERAIAARPDVAAPRVSGGPVEPPSSASASIEQTPFFD